MVDLTLDSDVESEDEAAIQPQLTMATSKPPVRPSPLPSLASDALRPAMGNLALPSGGGFTIDSTPFIRTPATLASTFTEIPSPGEPAKALAVASVVQRAPPLTSNFQTQTATIATMNNAGREAKRRKLSTSSREATIQDGVHAQGPKYAPKRQSGLHGAASSTQAQASPAMAGFTSLREKLNSMNGAPSVHYMNSALKSSASPIPILDDMPSQAARPLFIGRTPQGNTATGLPSPGLTTPEDVSAVVIDSDPLEPDETEIAYPPPPAASGFKTRGDTGHSSFQEVVSPAAPANVTAAQAQPLPHPFLLREAAPSLENIEHMEVDSTASDLVMRQTTPHNKQQGHMLSQPRIALPPATNLASPVDISNTGNATERADDLLIFLKEVKRLKWAEITEEFGKHIPGRSYSNLQSRYSTTLNRRDRTQDPTTLILPPKFAREATVNWAKVHADTKGPQPRRTVTDLSNKGSPHRSHVDRPKPIPRGLNQVKDDGDSSGAESAPQRQRARRAAPVNYTWPQLRTVKGGFEELASTDDPILGRRTTSRAQSRSKSPNDDMSVVPSRTSTSCFKPLNSDFSQQDARLGLTLQGDLRDAQQDRAPYLSSSQRLVMHKSSKNRIWDQDSIKNCQSTIFHVDFSPAELKIVTEVVAKFVTSGQTHHSTYRRHLKAVLKGLLEPKLQKLAYEIGRYLRSRDTQSIASFLEDAAAGKVLDVPHIQRLASTKSEPYMSCTYADSIPSRLRHRELGLQSVRGRQAASMPLTYRLKNQIIDTLGPKSTWTGASSDIHTVAWSPDGQYFAAGAVAVTDTDSMQYNRPNVLLYGDTVNGNIHELSEHFIKRPRPDAGANSTHAMYVSQDPTLFTTVSSVAFCPSGDTMYSAGYDNKVCVWDVSAGSQQPSLITKLNHKEQVDVLAVNEMYDGVIATATKRTTANSIKLIRLDRNTDNYEVANFASARAVRFPDLKMSANALRFDVTGQYLLAGFGANMREDSGWDTSGDICLWDVNKPETALGVYGSSRNVFDVAFNARPSQRGVFAVGCVANGNVNRGTRSVVRIYSPKEDHRRYTCRLELECKAFDMNDLAWW